MRNKTTLPVTVHLTKEQWNYVYKEAKRLKLDNEAYFPVKLMVQRIVVEAIKTAMEAQK